jgi:hypothetical protein
MLFLNHLDVRQDCFDIPVHLAYLMCSIQQLCYLWFAGDSRQKLCGGYLATRTERRRLSALVRMTLKDSGLQKGNCCGHTASFRGKQAVSNRSIDRWTD